MPVKLTQFVSEDGNHVERNSTLVISSAKKSLHDAVAGISRILTTLADPCRGKFEHELLCSEVIKIQERIKSASAELKSFTIQMDSNILEQSAEIEAMLRRRATDAEDGLFFVGDARDTPNDAECSAAARAAQQRL